MRERWTEWLFRLPPALALGFAAALCLPGGTYLSGPRPWALAAGILLGLTASGWLLMLPLMAACIVITGADPEENAVLLLLWAVTVLLPEGSIKSRRWHPALSVLLWLTGAVLIGSLSLALPQKSYVNHSPEIRRYLQAHIPSPPASLARLLGSAAGQLAGLEPHGVDLGAVGPRASLSLAVMEVTADSAGLLYLRERDHDIYDGRFWRATADRSEVFAGAVRPGGSITLRTRLPRPYRFTAYYPAGSLTLSGGGVPNSGRQQEYTLSLSALPEPGEQTLTEGPIPRSVAAFLALPEETAAQARALLSGALAGCTGAAEKAAAIVSLVSGGAEYDLQAERIPPEAGDFALWFLRESRRGYCVHFATAAAVLLRAAGVPARYVTGYLVWTQPGQTVTVTQDDAHAWAEYYDSALGCWRVAEATPALPAATGGASPTEVPLPETAPARLETQPQPPKVPPRQQAPEAPASRNGAWVILPVGMAVLWGQYRLRRLTRRRCANPNRLALLLWQDSRHLHRLLGLSPPQPLEDTACKAKFSPHVIAARELALFQKANAACAGRLKHFPGKYFLAKYIYAAL